jgi:hypothetical protein
MTVSVQAFLLADSVVVDQQTAKTIIHGVFDKVFAQSFPAQHPRCFLFGRLLVENKDSCDVGILIRSPSGSQEQPIPTQTMQANSDGLIQFIFDIQGFPLPEVGPYVISLIVNNSLASTFKLTAALLEPSNVSSTKPRHPVH